MSCYFADSVGLFSDGDDLFGPDDYHQGADDYHQTTSLSAQSAISQTAPPTNSFLAHCRSHYAVSFSSSS